MSDQILRKIQQKILPNVRIECLPFNPSKPVFASYYKDEKGFWVVSFSDIVYNPNIFSQCETDWTFLHEVGHIRHEDHNSPKNKRSIEQEFKADEWAVIYQGTNEYGISALTKYKKIIEQIQLKPRYDVESISIFNLNRRIEYLKRLNLSD